MFPVYLKVKEDSEFIFLKAETQGWRPKMEDFVIFHKVNGITPDQLDDLFGIFDGHGGYIVALFCKIVFPEVLEYNIKIIAGQ